MTGSGTAAAAAGTQHTRESIVHERDLVDHQIISSLLSNDQNLLAAICEGSIVGDAAATLSAEILSLLRQQGREITENFTKRLVRNKMQRFVQKGSDLADVLRDNSMASMCLNSYARYEGVGFLSTCLKPALAQVLSTVGTIELDPNKLPPGTPPSVIAQNETALKKAVTVILHGILDNKLHMPPSIRRLCVFLKNVILQSIRQRSTFQSGAPTAGASPSAHSSDASASDPTSESAPSVFTANVDSGAPLTAIGESESMGTIQRDGETSQTPPTVPGTDASQCGTSPTGAATAAASRQSWKASPFGGLLSRISASNGDAVDELGGATSPRDSRSGSNAARARIRPSPKLNAADAAGAAGSRKRSTSVQIDEKNRFSIVEKIVSSFLFLRFFIPAITSPDVYGLLPANLSTLTLEQRRALLICGKIFTGICNDVDFGHKEEHLVTLNEFLRKWRGEIRTYIRWAMNGTGETPLAEQFPRVSNTLPAAKRPVSAIGDTVLDSQEAVISNTFPRAAAGGPSALPAATEPAKPHTCASDSITEPSAKAACACASPTTDEHSLEPSKSLLATDRHNAQSTGALEETTGASTATTGPAHTSWTGSNLELRDAKLAKPTSRAFSSSSLPLWQTDQSSASLANLNKHGADLSNSGTSSSRIGAPKQFRTTNTLQPLGILGTDRHKLFAFLATHLDRLQASLQDPEFLARLTPSEREGIADNWEMLKRCIVNSPYAVRHPEASSTRQSKSSQSPGYMTATQRLFGTFHHMPASETPKSRRGLFPV